MALRFIVGRAGSGKTEYCLRAIADELARGGEGPALILLVPEQATFQMEQALLAAVAGRTGRRGFARAQVLSFRRLAWHVLQETGGAARPAVSDLGKRMVLRALLARQAGSLRLFDRVADRPGFIERLATTMDELAAYGHDARTLEEQFGRLASSGRGESVLAAKLHDLGVVIQAYQDYLLARGFSDPAQQLGQLAGRLPETGWGRGARIWVDGFSGFTPQELAVLEGLLVVARQVEVTLCLDPAELPPLGAGGPLDESSLFHPTLVTWRQLTELAERSGTPVTEPVVLPAASSRPCSRLAFPAAHSPDPESAGLAPPQGTGRGSRAGMAAPPRFRNPVLRHIEREFFRFPGRRYPGPAEGVAVVAAPNRRAEVAAAAREILRLVREEGYRFRDVAVIVRDLEAYHDLLVSAFAEHGIPLFVDRRRPVPHHPLVELVRAAVETVAADWPYEPVFRYLKTDLVPVPRGAVDRLENYVLAFGIRGRRWYDGSPWRWWRRFALEEDEEPGERQEEEIRAVNRIRDEAVRHLLAFHHRVAAARHRPRPVPELSAALYALLEELGVPERIQRWSEEAEAAGDLDRAQEHLQVWNGIVELLDQTAESLPDLELTLAEYLRVLEAGLEGLRVGLIPPGLDQVVAGTIERSRHPNVRAVLILGATEDAFPRRAEEDAIFSDAEREELEAAGLALGPTGRVRTLHEQYLTYLALTRASERLWISYPIGDEEGRAITPSWITRRLLALIPALGITPAASDDDPAALATPGQVVGALARQLRRAREGAPLEERWLDLYQWAVTEDGLRERVRPVLAALGYRNRVDDLEPAVARKLYGLDSAGGGVLAASVTRLESFASCPFQHFAAYGLRLREREIYRVDAPRLGRVYHAALSLLVRRVGERGLDWDELDGQRVRGLLDEILAELAPRLEDEIPTGTAYHRYLLGIIGRTLRVTVDNLAEQARRGSFRPLGVEVDFGPGARLPSPSLRLPGGERLVLRGRIDRIDAARAGDGRWLLRVIDYKSGPRDLALDKVYHGLSLQLAVYLLVVMSGAGALLPGTAAVEPAALLYVPVHDPYLDARRPLDAEEAARRRRREKLRASGWVLDDPEVIAALDREGQPADFVPVSLKKDGAPTRNSRVIDRSRLERLFRHVERRLTELGERLLAGRADVAPYRYKEESPCRSCSFRAVCQFEPRIATNRYRPLPALSPDDVWERLAGGEPAAGTEGGGDA
ncbi:MAG TPA: PD-(D/E)XK nuclease family protein [Thermaerobacter sp.]